MFGSRSLNVCPVCQSLLKDGVQLQERLSLLQVKGDLLDSVFGPDRSDGLREELSDAVRNRELLHAELLQRKSRLQVSSVPCFTISNSPEPEFGSSPHFFHPFL